MNFEIERQTFDKKQLLEIYKALLLPRLVEEKMLVLLRQGKISKWFSGIGQEAVSVGLTLALEKDEFILPMHRNLGVFTTRQVPLSKLFLQWQGKSGGFTKGRDRSFHFGAKEFNLIGMISHLGPQCGVADGIALAQILKGNHKVTAVFSGDGGTSEGDFHEALNVASVWSLPVMFCVENNGYGLSTPSSEQFKCEHIADKGVGYGMKSHIIDGNNVLEVYTRVKEIAENIRKNPHPVLIEFKTFRMRGHEEASGTKYVPKDLLNEWSKKDPLLNFQEFVKTKKVITEELEVEIKREMIHQINDNLKIAFDEKEIDFNLSNELNDVYKTFDYQEITPKNKKSKIRFVDAVSKGLFQSMEKFKNLLIMGQDIADYGGVFKVTEGFLQNFGSGRVRNTPICESSIIEAAYGLSICGFKSVVELQFSDFISSGFNPVINLLAKSHYRWGQNCDIVLRMPCGGGVGAGPFHSQTNEAWFTKTPGLKVVYPAFPYDAKGLLTAAIEDPNPVLFFEHKGLYRTVSQEVPDDYYNLPLGKAALVREGDKISIISFGAAVHWALEVVEKHNIDADVIDLRSLQPLDTDAIYHSVQKTGKVIILQEDSLFGGIASDISALISENCFEYLDAPIKRVASLEIPIPFAKNLENNYLPKNRFENELLSLLEY